MSSLAANTGKPLATIYCAENSISGKKYIGRTTRTLEIRKNEHFTTTIKKTHKFANALKCYPKESWNFYVLKEVEYEDADHCEFFFIEDLDTCNPDKGYNTLSEPWQGKGKLVINCNPEICYLYHVKYGEVAGTRSDLVKQYPELLNNLCKLLNRITWSLKGWVLVENKNNYEKITKGINKDGKICKPITLFHSSHGRYTLSYQEFFNQFGLNSSSICHLASGRRKSHKGWSLYKGGN